MRHIKIYESFVRSGSLPMDMDPAIADRDMDSVISDTDMDTGWIENTHKNSGHFETETTKFTPTGDNEEGNYIVNFINPDGENTTISIGHSIDPEYIGSSMISSIEMIPDSSSDGREYSVVGYYDEVPGSEGAYELKKVLIEQ